MSTPVVRISRNTSSIKFQKYFLENRRHLLFFRVGGGVIDVSEVANFAASQCLTSLRVGSYFCPRRSLREKFEW